MITRGLAPALVMAALIAPTAGAYQDISSQDMRDVAEASGRRDLRSQDALDAARGLPPDQLAAVAEGLRSRADGSDGGLVPRRVLDLVRIRLAGIAPSRGIRAGRVKAHAEAAPSLAFASRAALGSESGSAA
jgi:hypothetical protein